jgi:Protein of unknown function (DUF3775)
VCFIVEKSREYLGEEAGAEADDSNPAGDDEHVMLTEAAGPSIRRELVEFIGDLDVDEAAALVALTWIGRGDMAPREWKIAVAQAKERGEGPEIPSGYGAAAGLSRGCALRLRPLLRGPWGLRRGLRPDHKGARRAAPSIRAAGASDVRRVRNYCVDSELSCPVLAALHLSASSGFVPVGMWARRSVVHMSTGPPLPSGVKRRAGSL